MDQKPSVGRIVHYSALGSADGKFPVAECRAAIVTSVRDGKISLCVLSPTGMYFNEQPEQDELPPEDKIIAGERTTHKGGTWHWPERV